MGDCVYCGKPVGLLRSKHAECSHRHDHAVEQIRAIVGRGILGNASVPALMSSLEPIARDGFVGTSELESLSVDAWALVVEKLLDDGILTASEETQLTGFAHQAGLLEQVRHHASYQQVVKAAVLRDVAQGQIKSRVSIAGGVSINLQKGETLLWAFRDTEYLEDRERREFVGSSQGVSFRVMKGVYYRVGSFKGRPITRQERVSLGTGTLYVTDKNLYFAGSQKTMRVPYSKIVAFEQFTDGIGIMRDAATAKPQIFVTKDGWFTCNLVTQLAQR